ncbi:hypothetical protein RHMOL_Rhmol10G0205200 [Rhododendron molle]|uniref:Uncharacterized protein n=1 Tax=Rhododendron molle TaxID=49168 RepID=A0ACC0M5K3_RHOML|nr:hypothetical protein RHMOL_Rhmol10G0205200 [Rhododendron molle]
MGRAGTARHGHSTGTGRHDTSQARFWPGTALHGTVLMGTGHGTGTEVGGTGTGTTRKLAWCRHLPNGASPYRLTIACLFGCLLHKPKSWIFPWLETSPHDSGYHQNRVAT